MVLAAPAAGAGVYASYLRDCLSPCPSRHRCVPLLGGIHGLLLGGLQRIVIEVC